LRRKAATMPPDDKIPVNITERKDYCRRPACPYCGFSRSWKHGKYRRKGFHRPLVGPRQELVAVQRYVCRAPPCDRTFSELPEDVLPYCRFFLSDLLGIEDDWTEGKSREASCPVSRPLSRRFVRSAPGSISPGGGWLNALIPVSRTISS
jgi:hypothetical protein